eukprot:1255785-Prymnesium_polylepis.1
MKARTWTCRRDEGAALKVKSRFSESAHSAEPFYFRSVVERGTRAVSLRLFARCRCPRPSDYVALGGETTRVTPSDRVTPLFNCGE